MRKLIGSLIIFTLLIGAVPAGGFAADREGPLLRIRGTVRQSFTAGSFAIIGDDGQQYQPTTRLPRELRQDGLEVVAEARLREDIDPSGARGKPIDIGKIKKADVYIGIEDREAIRLLLARMKAFNDKNLAALQQIDVPAGSLSPDQFETWLANYGHYTLIYADITNPATLRLPPDRIEGICLYSRELLNGLGLFGNTDYTLMKFTLTKVNGDWKFTATGPYQPGPGIDPDQIVQQYLDKAGKKYGGTDLAKWRG